MTPAAAHDDKRPNLYGMARSELAALLASYGAPAYHGDQVFRWLYGRRSYDPAGWTDLPKPLRASLGLSARVALPSITTRVTANDGTEKYAMALPGGGTVESVYMVQRDRVTLCLSSQVGCALDCDFCLTARRGLVRHLTAGEIAGQARPPRRLRRRRW